MAMVLKEQIMDDECLQTVMCDIEFIVNGRPLNRVSDDSRDANALSPNHLLMLKSNKSYPPGIFSKKIVIAERDGDKRSFWWISFGKDGLGSISQLYSRGNSGSYRKEILKKNDIALIDDKPLPIGAWRFGRVLAVHKRKDGLVRSVKVKTCHSELVRPVDKLSLLEASDNKSCNDT